MTTNVLTTLRRDAVISDLQCSHYELDRLLRQKVAPLPVRIDGVILWYADELAKAKAKCQEQVAYWRKRRNEAQDRAKAAR